MAATVHDADRLTSPGRIADFDNSYAHLPEGFFVFVAPTPVNAPRLISFNRELAEELCLRTGDLADAALARVFSGNEITPGSEPLAMAYAGHQFGQFVPQLGDGRALLLGEVVDRHGERRDIQLKGSGRTNFSRSGDGRAALGPVLREYLVSEAMQALGVPTTRALAAVATGEAVLREARVPGAILTRVASSHIRIGTFQYFHARRDFESLRRLADYTLDRHYPRARESPAPYTALLREVVKRQACLVARWMQVGFIHGVMNTDNTSISGQTIDFGPCAFMDAYDPATVFSSIDHRGRYAYMNQPAAAQWNLARFAETLLPLIDADAERAIGIAEDLIASFAESFAEAWLTGMRAKLGLAVADSGDRSLIEELLALLQRLEADFTLTFRQLTPREGAPAPTGLEDWTLRWRARGRLEKRSPEQRESDMAGTNPMVIPRNHRVEQAIEAALGEDFRPFERLSRVLSSPYRVRAEDADLLQPPQPHERVLQTFCGT